MPMQIRSRFGALCKKQSDRFYEGLFSLLGGSEQPAASHRSTIVADTTRPVSAVVVPPVASDGAGSALASAVKMSEQLGITEQETTDAAATSTLPSGMPFADPVVLAAQVHKYRVQAQQLAEENARLAAENAALVAKNTFLTDILSATAPAPYPLIGVVDETVHPDFSVSRDILGLPSVVSSGTAEEVSEHEPAIEITATADTYPWYTPIGTIDESAFPNFSVSHDILGLPSAVSQTTTEGAANTGAFPEVGALTTPPHYTPIAAANTLPPDFSVSRNILGLQATNLPSAAEESSSSSALANTTEEPSSPSAPANTATDTATWAIYTPIAHPDSLPHDFSVSKHILGLPTATSRSTSPSPTAHLNTSSAVQPEPEHEPEHEPEAPASPSPPHTFAWNSTSALPSLHVHKRRRGFPSSSTATTDHISPPSSSVFSFSSAPSGGSGYWSQSENPFTKARGQAERLLQEALEEAEAEEAKEAEELGQDMQQESGEVEEAEEPQLETAEAGLAEELDTETAVEEAQAEGAGAESEGGEEAEEESEATAKKETRSRNGFRAPKGALKSKTKKLNAAEKKMKLRRGAGKVEPAGLKKMRGDR